MCERFRFDGALSNSDYSEIPFQAPVSDDVCKPCVVALVYHALSIGRSLGVFMEWKLKKIRNQFNLLIVVHKDGEREREREYEKLYEASFGIINFIILSLGIHNREKQERRKEKIFHNERNSNKTYSTLKNGKKLSEKKESPLLEHLPGCFFVFHPGNVKNGFSEGKTTKIDFAC